MPLLTALLYLLVTRGARSAVRRISGLHPVVSLVVFLMITLPWYLLATGASVGKGGPAALLHTARWVSWVLHGWRVTTPSPSPFVLLAALLPWCAFLPLALGSVPWRKPLRTLNEEQRLLLLLAISALLPILLIPFAALRTSSAVAASPFLCMLVARWLDRETTEADAMTVPPRLGRAGLRVSAGLLVAGTAAALLCVVLFLRTEPPSPHADLAALLHYAPGTSLRHLPSAAALGAFRGPLLIVGTAVFVGTLLNWQLRRSYRPHLGNIALAAATLVCLTEAHVALNTLAPVLSSQPLAAALAPMLRQGNRIVINGRYEEAATLGFYLQRDNLRLLRRSEESSPLTGDAPAAFETNESLRQQWTGPERIFLWTDPTKLPALPSEAYIVAEGGGKQIVSNKPGPY